VRASADDVDVAFLEGGRIARIAPLRRFWEDPSGFASSRLLWQRFEDLTDEDVLVPPVLPEARIFCVGLNYPAHVSEGIFQPPENPTIFGRWPSSLSVDGSEVSVPASENGLDWEGEVAVVVGGRIENVGPDSARQSIFGCAAFNDITGRSAQRLSHQWTLGKNLDRSGPIGPIVQIEEVGDLRDGLRLRTTVNGETVQTGNTADQIFEVGWVLSTISRSIAIRPGDILATGTPSGVGYARNPPRLLHGGDVVEVAVEKLGNVRTTVTES
jgi:2-keto-4-pentenoate hydratase/2-oxohepta-3-ene-1,7-dioic acid hydratase in catechol pathway